MTALAQRTEIKAGTWIRLRAYPVSVWVSDEEIDAAIKQRSPGKRGSPQVDRMIVARNIAIGKKCGSYPSTD